MKNDHDTLDIQAIVRLAQARRGVVIGNAVSAGLNALSRAIALGADALVRRWRPRRPLAAR